MPVIDESRCNGCGKCWTACPHSSIGATVAGVQQLRDAAADAADAVRTSNGVELTDDLERMMAALRRTHKQIAHRAGSMIRKANAASVEPEVLRDAWTWVAERLSIDDSERDEHERLAGETLKQAACLSGVVTAMFFDEPESEKKGNGLMLCLAVDPRTCRECGICAEVCPEEAIATTPVTAEWLTSARAAWRRLEALPDTDGAVIARARGTDLGSMASILLSRHCAQAQVGDGHGEPGSGERLASRLVTAIAEYHGQRHLAWLASGMQERKTKLLDIVRGLLSKELTAELPETIESALEGIDGTRVGLSELGSRLEALGESATVNRHDVLRRVRMAKALDVAHDRLTAGASGLGRARFSVLVVGDRLDDWISRFSFHPFFAPMVSDRDGSADLAIGLAEGLRRDHLELIRTVRAADLLIESPPDLEERLPRIDHLGWSGLTDEERRACPPLLLFAEGTWMAGLGRGDLSRLLDTDLPVLVVLLDALDVSGPMTQSAAPFMPFAYGALHRNAFTAAASIAYPDHLADALERSLAGAGPALIHVHAPSPARDGIRPSMTIERARLAVEARAFLLAVADPRAEGLFGLRMSLDGNPSPDADWGDIDYAEWAGAGSRSVADAERQSCLDRWKMLKEIAGIDSPFVDRIRDEMTRELEAERDAWVSGRQREFESREAELASNLDQRLAARLRQRLMNLAGVSPRER